MRIKSSRVRGLLVLLLFPILFAVFIDLSFAANCDPPMGEPGKACCHPDDPSLPCCATLESCGLGITCKCNVGNRCVMASPTSMLYYVCISDEITCGENVGDPCCEEEGSGGPIWKCKKPDTLACNFDTMNCELCGSEGQICCNNSTRCHSGLACYDGICKDLGDEPETDCNESNELCCYNWGVGRGNTCQIIDGVPPIYENCYCENSLTCTRVGTEGRCIDPVTCGGNNQPCCNPPLEECEEGLECSPTLKRCVGNSEEPYKGPVYNGPIIESLEEILNPAVRILYYGGLFVGIFFIILSGYKLMTSEGDPQKTKEAQEQLTSAIIGIIFILLSTTIIRIIISEIIGI